MNIHYWLSILFAFVAAASWFSPAAAIGLSLLFFLKGVIKNGSNQSR